jgi:hypothetical protein
VSPPKEMSKMLSFPFILVSLAKKLKKIVGWGGENLYNWTHSANAKIIEITKSAFKTVGKYQRAIE